MHPRVLHRVLVVAILLVVCRGATDLTEPKYRIEFVSELPEQLLDGQSTFSIPNPVDHLLYKCILPDPDFRIPESEVESGPPEDVDKVLNPLTGACLYRIEGWWTYEFCYGEVVRQFHQENQDIIAEFFLGRGPPQSLEPSVHHYSELYRGGTPCDLTGRNRSTEVQYVCSTDNKSLIISVTEEPTCHYTLVVHTNLLCKHAFYQPKTDPSIAITCLREPGASNMPFIGEAEPPIESL